MSSTPTTTCRASPGTNEASHGLSDTLLSLVALRTGEISDALLDAHAAARHEAMRAA